MIALLLPERGGGITQHPSQHQSSASWLTQQKSSTSAIPSANRSCSHCVQHRAHTEQLITLHYNPQQTAFGCRKIHNWTGTPAPAAHWSLLPNHYRTLLPGSTLSGISVMVRDFGSHGFSLCVWNSLYHVELPVPCWFRIHGHISRKCLSNWLTEQYKCWDF